MGFFCFFCFRDVFVVVLFVVVVFIKLFIYLFIFEGRVGGREGLSPTGYSEIHPLPVKIKVINTNASPKSITNHRKQCYIRACK